MSAVGDFFTNLASGVATAGLNYGLSELTAERNAAINYGYNEKAAQNADRRTRALYADYMSPAARIRQLKEAGLSPSLYADGAGGGSMGVTSGAQGGGASGVSTAVAPISAPDMAAIKLANAQAEKADAEATNISTDTEIKEIKRNVEEMAKLQYQINFEVMNAAVKTKSGQTISLYELASECRNYDEFVKRVRETAESPSGADGILLNAINTEKGQETLRGIYLANDRFERDIATLGSEKVDAKFKRRISEELNSSEFAKLNAQEACQKLRTSISTEELTADQKDAWNNLINRLEKKNDTLADVVIVLAMIFNQGMTNWR